MAKRDISKDRQAVYYLGTIVMVIGVLMFLSVFISGAANFGNFDNFEGRAQSEMIRAIAGMVLVAIGGGLKSVGSRGLAGSGVILDPEQSREDLEPWSRMTGGMVKDAADEAGLVPAVAVIGDSTFTHSGITGLLDAVLENSPITIIISDNSTTGMTGGQKSAATGRLERICAGIGVESEHLITIDPMKKNHETNVNIILKELEYSGVSVIIAQRECIQTAIRRKRIGKVADSQNI
jgi:hypothetical protein